MDSMIGGETRRNDGIFRMYTNPSSSVPLLTFLLIVHCFTRSLQNTNSIGRPIICFNRLEQNFTQAKILSQLCGEKIINYNCLLLKWKRGFNLFRKKLKPRKRKTKRHWRPWLGKLKHPMMVSVISFVPLSL